MGVDTCHGPGVEARGGLVTIAAVVDRAQLLGRDPGGRDLTVLVAGLDAGQQPRPRGSTEVLGAAAQHPADPIQRICAAAPMPTGLLLHTTAHVIHGGEPEPHDVEAIQYRIALGRPADSAAP